MDAKVENFLAELSALTNEYSLVIAGCGCCGSPRVEEGDAYMIGHYIVDTDDSNLEYRD